MGVLAGNTSLCRILGSKWKIPLWCRHQESHEEGGHGEKYRRGGLYGSLTWAFK